MNNCSVWCTVCLEHFCENEVLVATSCGHLMHKDCLDGWVQRKETCPQCRGPFDPLVIRMYLNIDNEAEKNEKYTTRKVGTLLKDFDEI